MDRRETDSVPALAPPGVRMLNRAASMSPGPPWPALLLAAWTKSAWSRRIRTLSFACGADEDANAAPAAPSVASPVRTAAPTAAARREICMMILLVLMAGHNWDM